MVVAPEVEDELTERVRVQVKSLAVARVGMENAAKRTRLAMNWEWRQLDAPFIPFNGIVRWFLEVVVERADMVVAKLPAAKQLLTKRLVIWPEK